MPNFVISSEFHLHREVLACMFFLNITKIGLCFYSIIQTFKCEYLFYQEKYNQYYKEASIEPRVNDSNNYNKEKPLNGKKQREANRGQGSAAWSNGPMVQWSNGPEGPVDRTCRDNIQ